MPIKVLVLGGGIWFLLGGSGNFIFMGARIFLSIARILPCFHVVSRKYR